MVSASVMKCGLLLPLKYMYSEEHVALELEMARVVKLLVFVSHITSDVTLHPLRLESLSHTCLTA